MAVCCDGEPAETNGTNAKEYGFRWIVWQSASSMTAGRRPVRTDAFHFGQMDGKMACAFFIGGDAEEGALRP